MVSARYFNTAMPPRQLTEAERQAAFRRAQLARVGQAAPLPVAPEIRDAAFARLAALDAAARAEQAARLARAAAGHYTAQPASAAKRVPGNVMAFAPSPSRPEQVPRPVAPSSAARRPPAISGEIMAMINRELARREAAFSAIAPGRGQGRAR